MAEMAEMQATLLWTIGRLDELRAQGLVSGGNSKLSGGVAIFEQLKADGWMPKTGEIRSALGALDIPVSQHETLLRLLLPRY